MFKDPEADSFEAVPCMPWARDAGSESALGMDGLQRSWGNNKGEIYSIVRLSIPVSTGFLLTKLVSFVSVILVGHLGPAELAAAALGSSLINVVGNSVLAGLAGAMSTLCGQVTVLNHFIKMHCCL